MSPVTSPVTFHEVIKVSIVTRGNDVSGISVNSKSVAGKAFFSLSLRYPVLLCLYSSGWTWRRTHKTSSIWLQGCLQRLHNVVGKGKRPWQSRGGFCTSCVHGTPEFCTCGISQFVPQASGAVFASLKPGIVTGCRFSFDRGVVVPRFRPCVNLPLILKVKALVSGSGCIL